MHADQSRFWSANAEIGRKMANGRLIFNTAKGNH